MRGPLPLLPSFPNHDIVVRNKLNDLRTGQITKGRAN